MGTPAGLFRIPDATPDTEPSRWINAFLALNRGLVNPVLPCADFSVWAAAFVQQNGAAWWPPLTLASSFLLWVALLKEVYKC